MSSMWFGLEGIGYDGLSGGNLHLITEFCNHYYYYKIACQGTSFSWFTSTNFFSVRNDSVTENYDLVEHDNLLMYLTNNIIKVEIPDVFVVRGTVEFNFELYSKVANIPDPLFKCKRRVEVEGSSIGDIKILTEVQRPPVMGMSTNQVRALTRYMTQGTPGF